MFISIVIAVLFFGMMIGSGITGMAAHPTNPTASDAVAIGLETVGLGLTLIIGLGWILAGLIIVVVGVFFLLVPVLYLNTKK